MCPGFQYLRNFFLNETWVPGRFVYIFVSLCNRKVFLRYFLPNQQVYLFVHKKAILCNLYDKSINEVSDKPLFFQLVGFKDKEMLFFASLFVRMLIFISRILGSCFCCNDTELWVWQLGDFEVQSVDS